MRKPFSIDALTIQPVALLAKERQNKLVSLTRVAPASVAGHVAWPGAALYAFA